MQLSLTMLDTSHFYRDLGFSQLPLRGKLPALDHWKHLTKRRPTDAELLLWFYQTRNNIGIICGQISGIVAFDADSQEMVRWLERDFPSTEMRTLTAKGMHFFYRIEKGQDAPTRVRVNDMMLDIRGEASYVVAAPSIHPDGPVYERVGSWNLEKVPVFSPEWLPAAQPAGSQIRRKVKDPMTYIANIHSIQGHGGSNACFRAVCVLRDVGFDQLDALAAIIQWNSSGNAVPPWSLRELTKKVRDVFSKPIPKGA